MRFVLLAVFAACVPAPAPLPPRQPDPPPRCDGTPDAEPAGERGVKPFSSEPELEAAVGHTVYLTSTGPLQAHLGGLGAGAYGVFGEPLVLCAAVGVPNRHLVQSEEVVRARLVLAKTPGGTIVDVELAAISSRAPRFSLAAPSDAVAMLLGAFGEARDANARFHELPAGRAPLDRAAEGFWTMTAREQAEKVRKEARTVATQLAHGMGRYVRTRERGIKTESGSATAPKTEDGAPWVDHADATVRAWMERGIPKGPTRVAYEHVVTCAYSDGDEDCAQAAEIVQAPPPPPAAATTGGKLLIHVAPKRVLATATIEVDGQAVAITGEEVAVDVAADGKHAVHATAPRARPFDRTVDVSEGKAVKVPVMLLP